MKKIRKGDKVIILSGKCKGRTGEVIKINPKNDTGIVKGINIVKRHQKPTKTQEGGIIKKESSINLSNLSIIDPKDGKATRVGFIVIENGKKVRFSKRSGEVIDA